MLRSAACGAVGLLLALLANRAAAQDSANPAAVYNGWLQAYLVTSGSQTYFCNSLTDRSNAFMWGQAYMITAVEDAYEQDHAAARQQLISSLFTTFIATNGNDLSWDTWDDDMEWAEIALIRAYLITGTSTYLSNAEQNWNETYSRGWDSTYGGGIWENMNKNSKCTLSNCPFTIAGCFLYEATGNSTYLTESEAAYAWVRSKLFNTTTGQVNEGINSSGLEASDNVYNSGLMVEAANALYKITGTSSYLNDAKLAASHIMNEYPILTQDKPANGDFGADQFVRGLNRLASQNNLWPTYWQYLANQCASAWTNRRTDYNITWNNWASPTPTGNVDAMEALGSVVVQAVTPPRLEAESLTVPGYSGPDYRVVTDSNMSNGEGVILDSMAVGNYISFLVPSLPAGTYDVRVAVKKFNSRGICQLAIGQAGNHSPVNVGAPQDMYSSSAQYVELDLGHWTPATTGDKWFWFTITGKNSASTGYTECFDYILLLPQQ
jgi:predicted alpha-1,6-mannanase (GH76 family)